MVRLGAARHGKGASAQKENQHHHKVRPRQGSARQGSAGPGKGASAQKEDSLSKAEKVQFALGLPTGPDVKRIEDALGDIRTLRGHVIPHDAIESVIKEGRDTNRYRSVVTAWKSKVRREYGIEISGRLPEVIGIGHKVLTDAEQLTFGTQCRDWAAKRVRRGYRAIAGTDDSQLTEPQRQIKAHELITARRLATAFVETKRIKLPEPSSSPQLPPMPK